jgi:signal peptidase I
MTAAVAAEPVPSETPRRPHPVVDWGAIEQGLIPPGHPVETGGDTPLPTSPSRGRSARNVVKDIAETLLLALIIYLGVRAGVQNFKVEGSSMEPSLHNGQYLLVNKMAYAAVDLDGVAEAVPPLQSWKGSQFFPFGLPQRGDIVVFRFPRDPSRDFIKRVVAVPGETVEVRAGVVFVNNKKLTEPYILDSPTYSKEPTVVPPGEYFVLGDNRNNSSDSHVWGPVPVTEIVGKAWVTYWPMKDWGFIPHTAAASD